MLSSLPSELIHLILSHLVPERPEDPKYVNGYPQNLQNNVAEGRRTLRELCHCSRQIYSVAQPLLYRFVLAESTEQLMLLVRTLSAKPELALEISSLAVYTTELGEAPKKGNSLKTDADPSVAKMKTPRLPPRFYKLDGRITVDLQVSLTYSGTPLELFYILELSCCFQIPKSILTIVMSNLKN
jgi:hypothetical protein